MKLQVFDLVPRLPIAPTSNHAFMYPRLDQWQRHREQHIWDNEWSPLTPISIKICSSHKSLLARGRSRTLLLGVLEMLRCPGSLNPISRRAINIVRHYISWRNDNSLLARNPVLFWEVSELAEDLMTVVKWRRLMDLLYFVPHCCSGPVPCCSSPLLLISWCHVGKSLWIFNCSFPHRGHQPPGWRY